MKKKSVFTGRLIYSIFFTMFLIYLFNKTSNGKIILIPFLICSLASLGKNIFIILEKQNYVKVCNKIFVLGFLMFLFGFLIFGIYTSFVNKNYIFILLSIPFLIGGLYIFKKKFLKEKNVITSKIKSKFNFKIIVSSSLVIITFIAGIIMLFYGIRDTYRLNKKTKNYITTNGYYNDYDIYKSDKDGTTFKLIYIYEVDNIEYSIMTDYGTSYIPDKNSIREVKYNPNNPEEAIIAGTNNKNSLIFIGAFFTLGAFTFILFALTLFGCFDKLKIDIIGTYIGVVFLIIGIGIILFQNMTTMSFIETVKSFGLWILIPLMFIIVGIYQIIKCLFLNRENKK